MASVQYPNSARISDTYLRHRSDEDHNASESHLPSRYVAQDTVDCLHHDRMYASLDPLLRHAAGTSWMTVGDGRFGTDANFLRPHVRSVLATSISASTLEIAKRRSWIDAYSEENAEKISFDDEQFDYVLCKEAYHHFPRPAVGLYEMLRVSRLGVVLIEPLDGHWSPLGSLKRSIKRFLRGEHPYDQFEPVGNFVFRLSRSETFKIMTALGYYGIAWRSMNGFWWGPLSGASKSKFSARLAGYWSGVYAQDMACSLRLLSPGLVTMICLKKPPAPELLRDLKKQGFRIEVSPKNPYT
ncbi:class I SAM-dependent methyltransferase [Rhizobium sp. 1399]|jgi:ubiquinone/menaquinone biosynthesis C-methylase UbiE|uniref:class I SAM-dependent methyltransferase n=1 Tax=Rhizobium sp. 1399 TaxID=2817758 RepID=UPI002863ADEF|nr:class I SAM-dependent methyltransferase [Rhizobium sp. 1399]MDR6669336.1 ubiquinone/menaquinone biosynthesis C-methylase UbiE [Rhizobium sp. 1399]